MVLLGIIIGIVVAFILAVIITAVYCESRKDKKRRPNDIWEDRMRNRLGLPWTFTRYGLDKESRYRFYNREFKIDIRMFGDLINMIAPIHIRNGSTVHDMISRLIKLDGEKEDVVVYS